MRSAERNVGGRKAWLIRIAVSAGVLGAVAWFVDPGTLVRTLTAIPIGVFAVAFGLNLLGSIVVPALQTRIALGATRIRLGVAELIGINLMVRFFILVLPRPAAVGLRWWAYRQGGEENPGSDAAALMVFERLVQAAVLTGFLVVLLALELGNLPSVSNLFLLLAVALFVATAGGLLAFLWAPAAAVPRRLLTWQFVPGWIRRRALRLMEAVDAYPSLSKVRITLIVWLSIVYFVLFVLSFLVILLGLNVEMAFTEVAWIRIMVFLFTLIPATIAGIGVREAGFVGLLQLYGVSREVALAAALAALAVQLMIGLLGAGVVLWRQWRGQDPREQVRVTPTRPAPE